MARLQVHFSDGTEIWLDHPASGLGRSNMTSNGMIETKDVNGQKVWINPEHIAYVREHDTK